MLFKISISGGEVTNSWGKIWRKGKKEGKKCDLPSGKNQISETSYLARFGFFARNGTLCFVIKKLKFQCKIASCHRNSTNENILTCKQVQ
jgi:hypothetical protein